MYQQSQKEIGIFKKFAGLVPYQIDQDSIKKEDPPKPDISFILSDGSMKAFELVECIDKSLAKSLYSSWNLKKIFYDRLEKLPGEKKERFKINFKNALIYVAFVKGISANKKKSAVSRIFDYLLTLENTAEGEFNLKSSKDLKDIVGWISINRGVGGPIFDVEAISSFSDPALERIKDKFNKKYKIRSETDLLAYYELQPEIPENRWLPQVEEFIKNNIKTSVFQRVWIYSITKNRIIFTYP